MKNHIWIPIIITLAFIQNLPAQLETGDFIDLSQIMQAKVTAMDGVNSEMYEFAPAWFGDGLVFVYSNTEKKRIRKKDEMNFRLMYSPLDSSLNAITPTEFDEVRTRNTIEGPVSFDPYRPGLFVTKNLHGEKIERMTDELKLGVFYYTLEKGLWEFHSELPVNSSAYNVCHPAWDAGSKRLIFASDMPGGFGGLDLYSITRTPDGHWTQAQNLGPAINSAGNDCFPYLHKGEFLFFSSDRVEGAGGLDLYFSRIKMDGWYPAIMLPAPLNSASDDLGLIVHPSGQHLLFASSRPGGKGKDDLYAMSLGKDLFSSEPDMHQITVVDKRHGTPLEGCEIRIRKFSKSKAILESHNETVRAVRYELDPADLADSGPVLITGKDGRIHFQLAPGEYILHLSKDSYIPSYELIEAGDNPMSLSYGLDSLVCRPFSIVFLDRESGERVSEVSIWQDNGKDTLKVTEGLFTHCIMPGSTFGAKIIAKTYKEQWIELSHDSIEPGTQMEISMEQIEKYVQKLPVEAGEIFVLKNILYDFDSHALNKQSMMELDKLVAHMKEHPSLRIELSSHTDARGSAIYNQALSEKRADNVKNYLVGSGISADRIAAIGFGESRLLNECADGVPCQEQQHAINRRTEVKVLE